MEYYQPFLQLTPLAQYPEVHDIVSELFPLADRRQRWKKDTGSTPGILYA